jgi:hypothetical protein
VDKASFKTKSQTQDTNEQVRAGSTEQKRKGLVFHVDQRAIS